MSEIGRETARTIELLREADEPSDVDRARVRSALALKLTAGATVALVAREGAVEISRTVSGGSSALTNAATGVGAGGSLVAKIAGVIAISAGLVVAATSVEKQLQTPPPQRLAAQAAPGVTLPVVPQPSAALSATSPSMREHRMLPTPAVPKRRPVNTGKPDAAKPGATLPANAANDAAANRDPRLDVAAESALLSNAASALRRRDFGRAFASLNEHARRFPAGVLGEERDAMRVRALVQSGDSAAACSHGQDFARRFPTSAYEPETRAACAGAAQSK